MSKDRPDDRPGTERTPELTPPGSGGIQAATPGVETVDVASLARRVPPPKVPKPKTFLEWSGTWQMSLLLGFICLLAGGFLWGWVASRPDLQDAVALVQAAREAGDETVVDSQELSQLLSDLQKAHSDQFGDLFQLVVMTALVPLFTLLAGYVFGRGQQARQPTDEEDEGG